MVLVDFSDTWEGRRAVVVSPVNGEEGGELVELLHTLDVEVVALVSQRVAHPNPRYYIGSGKVEEIALLRDEGVDTCVVDADLRPSQIFNLQRYLGMDVFDRSRVILQVFLQHARMREARLQVEYALLKYQVPMVKELIRRGKMSEHPGLMAGGEYKVSDYYQLIRRRMKRIRRELKRLRVHRAQRRRRRTDGDTFVVAIAGYTNAGKSSLLNALSHTGAHVDSRMFATLDTAVRRIDRGILAVDTVGFIRSLPPQLIEAFRSTLEEIAYSDLILLVVDLTDPPETAAEKIETSLAIVRDICSEADTGEGTPPIELVFNKADAVASPVARANDVMAILAPEIRGEFSGNCIISARDGTGIQELRARVKEKKENAAPVESIEKMA